MYDVGNWTPLSFWDCPSNAGPPWFLGVVSKNRFISFYFRFGNWSSHLSNSQGATIWIDPILNQKYWIHAAASSKVGDPIGNGCLASPLVKVFLTGENQWSITAGFWTFDSTKSVWPIVRSDWGICPDNSCVCVKHTSWSHSCPRTRHLSYCFWLQRGNPKIAVHSSHPLQYHSMFLQQSFQTKHLLLGPKDLGPGRVVFNFGSSGQILWHPHLCRPRKIWPQSAELEQLQYAAAEGDLLCSKYYRLWSLGFRGEGDGRWTAGGPPHITAFVRVHCFWSTQN